MLSHVLCILSHGDVQLQTCPLLGCSFAVIAFYLPRGTGFLAITP